MPQFINPFETDTSYYKQLIEEDKKPYESDPSVVDSLNAGTSSGFPASAFAAIQKAKEKAHITKEKQEEATQMFTSLFNDLNKKYGLNIQFSADSFGKSIEYIIEPTNKKALELYLSEAYSRFRVVLYQQYLQAIACLSAQILDPQFLLSDSMTYDAKLQTMRSLYEFMQMMNDIYEQVNIKDAELKLEKVSEDKNRVKVNLNDPNLRSFMEAFAKSLKEDPTEDVEAQEVK